MNKKPQHLFSPKHSPITKSIHPTQTFSQLTNYRPQIILQVLTFPFFIVSWKERNMPVEWALGCPRFSCRAQASCSKQLGPLDGLWTLSVIFYACLILQVAFYRDVATFGGCSCFSKKPLYSSLLYRLCLGKDDIERISRLYQLVMVYTM